MKYSIQKEKTPALLNVNNLWAKKFSEIHIGNRNKTLCGRPMLGNNYNHVAIEEDRQVCLCCLNHLPLGDPKTKPEVKLSGKDGNVFNLIGLCSKALKKAGQTDEAEQMVGECFKAGSYDEALQIMMKYCDVN